MIGFHQYLFLKELTGIIMLPCTMKTLHFKKYSMKTDIYITSVKNIYESYTLVFIYLEQAEKIGIWGKEILVIQILYHQSLFLIDFSLFAVLWVFLSNNLSYDLDQNPCIP